MMLMTNRKSQDDLKSVIRSRNQLAKMLTDSEARLNIALEETEIAFKAGYNAGWDLGYAKAIGKKTEFDPRMAYIEWDQEERHTLK